MGPVQGPADCVGVDMANRRTVSQIVEELKWDIMRRNPKISYWGPMSVVRTLAEAYAIQIYEIEKEIQRMERALFIDSATGSDLDRLVKDRLPGGRYPGTKASGEVVFLRDTPALADINIPAGTRLAAVGAGMETLYFVTTEDAVLPSGEMSVVVNAVAEEIGTAGNVMPYTINQIASSLPGISRVENYFAFSGGSDQESDEDLRKRYVHAVNVPGRATRTMIEQHLYDMDVVLEARCYNIGRGEVEIIVDCTEPTSTVCNTVSNKIKEEIAAGVVSRGLYAAYLSPSGSTYDIGDCMGGYIWLRPEELIRSTETVTINFKDTSNNNASVDIPVPRYTLRGEAIRAPLPENVMATRVVGSSPVSYSYSVLIGRGDYPYLFNLPETVNIAVAVSITTTDTPERNLEDNIEQSIADFLNSFRIGEKLEFSDLAQYVYHDFSTDRKFTGIDTVNNIQISGNGMSINKYGEEISVETDQRIRAGSITVSVL